MSNLPMVSVLMTVYNREKYIRQAIESVIASTYQHWELIIVDDLSKDESVAIANSYAEKDERIKVYVNEKNLGDYPNRNQAAAYAKGKYLKYVDADDMIYPHGLEILVYYMEQFPEAGYGLCTMEKDDNHMYPFQLSPNQAYHRHYFGKPIFIRAPLSSIIRRDAFLERNGFSGSRYYGDFEFWNLMSKKYPVVLMPQGIVWYRRHDEQELSNYTKDFTIFFSYYKVSENFLKDDDCPLTKEEAEKAYKKIQKKKSRHIAWILRKAGYKDANKLYKMSGFNILTFTKNFIQ